MKVRVNSDDFGISPGVNFAVETMFQNKQLDSASLICGSVFFDQAVEIAKRNPGLKIGLHFNLTSGASVLGYQKLPLLTNQNGNFKNGFLKIVLLSLFRHSKLHSEAKQELDAQIDLIKKLGIKLSHIDSHRHIHYIPPIFSLVAKAAQVHGIDNIRIINESIFSENQIKNLPFKNLLWGGLIKWAVLRLLGIVNGAKNIQTKCYFFSIINSCNISQNLIEKIKLPNRFDELEIMIHPGNPDIDKQEKNLLEKNHLLSRGRITESQITANKIR